jgi:hypothetical protein
VNFAQHIPLKWAVPLGALMIGLAGLSAYLYDAYQTAQVTKAIRAQFVFRPGYDKGDWRVTKAKTCRGLLGRRDAECDSIWDVSYRFHTEEHGYITLYWRLWQDKHTSERDIWGRFRHQPDTVAWHELRRRDKYFVWVDRQQGESLATLRRRGEELAKTTIEERSYTAEELAARGTEFLTQQYRENQDWLTKELERFDAVAKRPELAPYSPVLAQSRKVVLATYDNARSEFEGQLPSLHKEDARIRANRANLTERKVIANLSRINYVLDRANGNPVFPRQTVELLKTVSEEASKLEAELEAYSGDALALPSVGEEVEELRSMVQDAKEFLQYGRDFATIDAVLAFMATSQADMLLGIVRVRLFFLRAKKPLPAEQQP